MPPEHECKKEEEFGRIKEFMENAKGMKTTMAMIGFAILLQVGTFLYLWGTLTTTVANNTKQVWGELTPTAVTNAKNIATILTRLDNAKCYANDKK